MDRIKKKKNQTLIKSVIAEEIIEFIRERTAKFGEDKRGNKFPKYTKTYAKAKGVPRSEVDLVMSSEMLEELEQLSIRGNSIVIGYKASDTELNGKVEGNLKGTYGQPSPIRGKKRDFLGIQSKERDRIIRGVLDGNI